MRKEKRKTKPEDTYSEYKVLEPSNRRKQLDEIVISPKGRVSFPSAVIYKGFEGKNIFCVVMYSEGKQELIFSFGPQGMFPVKNGTIELYSVLKRNGILPDEKLIRKFLMVEASDKTKIAIVRLKERDQYILERMKLIELEEKLNA